MDKPVIIFGASNIARDALAIFESNGIVVYGFLDDDEKRHGQEINNVGILGSPDDYGFLKLIGQKCEAFVALESTGDRQEMVNYLKEQRKVMPTNAVHQSALIDEHANIGHGNFINARAVLGPEVEIGQHCVIHSGAIIESGAKIGDFVQIGAGAIINNHVTINEGAFVGSGSIVVSGVTVGKNASIGAGSLVARLVEESSTVFGVPAAEVK